MSKMLTAVKGTASAVSVVLTQYFPTIRGLEFELKWASLPPTILCVLVVFLLAIVDPPNPRELVARFPKSALAILIAVLLSAFYYVSLFYWIRTHGYPSPYWLYPGVATYAVISMALASAITYLVCLTKP